MVADLLRRLILEREPTAITEPDGRRCVFPSVEGVDDDLMTTSERPPANGLGPPDDS